MREQLRAAKRTVVVLSQVLEVPILGPAVRALTRRPHTESVEIAGVSAELVTPAVRGPRPAFVFITGAHPLRRREPIVQRVAQSLGRAGFVVVVPDLPGLGEGEITPRGLEAAIGVVEWAARRDEVAGGRIVVCGASVGAGLALILAGREEVAGSISVVAAVCPFGNLEKIICLATTRQYGHDGQFGVYDSAILLRRVVARSLLASLPEGPERTELLGRAGDVLHEHEDAIEGLRAIDAERLGPDARAILALLTNSDAARFQGLYDGLPAEAHARVASLSPLPRAAEVRARVELVAPPLDPYFPPAEMQVLAAALPRARLTISGALDHTRPSLSWSQLPDLRRLSGFVLRSLSDG